jgi:hypothetical protein
MRRDKPEWAFFRPKWCAVHGIRNNYLGFENPRIKFRQGKNHSIAILRSGDNISRHRGTTKLFALRNPGSTKEFFKKHTLIRFRLLVVRIHNRERFPWHVFQINNGQNERSGDSTARFSPMRTTTWAITPPS